MDDMLTRPCEMISKLDHKGEHVLSGADDLLILSHTNEIAIPHTD